VREGKWDYEGKRLDLVVGGGVKGIEVHVGAFLQKVLGDCLEK
jgi:hypothetical protein